MESLPFLLYIHFSCLLQLYNIPTSHTFLFFFYFFENSEMQTTWWAELVECVFLSREPEQMHFILLNHPCCVLAMTQSVLIRLETGTTHIFKWVRPQRVTEQFPLFMEKGYCSAIGIPMCPPHPPLSSKGLRINSWTH